MILHNQIDKKILKECIKKENLKRQTLSFYRYIALNELSSLRDELYKKWHELQVLGRVYIAQEGINAQVSVPQTNWHHFQQSLNEYNFLHNIPLKIAIENSNISFYKLKIKVRKKIVADGLSDGILANYKKKAKYLPPQDFNTLMEDANTITVDVRNHYESEVGHFTNAYLPDTDTFQEAITIIHNQLKGKEKHKILLYCTGGIRCEKMSAYLYKNHFKNVYQLQGGIIEYARQVKQRNFTSKFRGKNFVFDDRLGERITNEIISKCHQCGKLADTHTNCKNDACHLLFIQCENCATKMLDCCSKKCKDVINLPFEKQKKLRKNQPEKEDNLSVYKSRLRPRLRNT